MCVGGNKLQHVPVVPSGLKEVRDYLICLTIATKGAGVVQEVYASHLPWNSANSVPNLHFEICQSESWHF